MSHEKASKQSNSPDTKSTTSHQAPPISESPDIFSQLPIQDSRINTTTMTHKDILRLQRTIGNQATLKLLNGSSDTTVQRNFQPARVRSKTHLRPALGATVLKETKTGRNIPSDAEVVIDQTDQIVQHRKLIPNVTWTRAVDTTAANWDPANDPMTNTYIRNAKVAPKVYPKPTQIVVGDRGPQNLQIDWHEDVGEYIIIEKSIQTPADDIVKIGPDFGRMNAAHQLFALTPREESQIDRTSYVVERLRGILQNAAIVGGLNPALLANPENMQGLKNPLRISLSNADAGQKNKWFTWAQNVFAKVTQGATEAVASINHWKSQIYPPDITQVQVTKVEIEGSDLHDHGLGAIFVTYTKPSDANGMFPNVASIKVVIKPEDRNIEKSLFGTQATSLANQVNVLAGLNPADSVSTIKMETHANHGSIIEFVQGQMAKAKNGHEVDTQAMSEGVAFAFLAGMSDVHQENVIWNNGKPYFIDADNSLNAGRLNQASSQSGFSKYNQARTTTDVNDINNNVGGSRSGIIQAMLANSTPFLVAIQAAFNNKQGRVVPLFTNFWANRFKNAGYIQADDGVVGDNPPTHTRWAIANQAAAKIPRGNTLVGGDVIGYGLAGEAGIAAGGHNYQPVVAAAQTKADLDQGKIPFFTYDYTTGQVSQNGQAIWDGQTLADAMAILLAKFPAPPPLVVGGGGP
ncbi:MAG: DUF4135 domain-containing protein [Burkholderiales bacterium]|nr:DUF4135 domain-containing protein [Anaerolineae bacterium]